MSQRRERPSFQCRAGAERRAYGGKPSAPRAAPKNVELGAGLDYEAVTVHSDRDSQGGPLGTRSGFISVELTCAAGHGSDFIIGNHKRAEFVGVAPLT